MPTTPDDAARVPIDIEKIIETAELCKEAAASGDQEYQCYMYADFIIRTCRTVVPTPEPRRGAR
ncbi:MAG: hypothetical protein JO267_14285 [Alphaproteobacteria bacterium]|nr:hypothetical protein [Alphaproteobacteria bacterium]